ncbi:MAG: PulJ/GspJ family protein [Candidatus Rifleibacteriota bacterium]
MKKSSIKLKGYTMVEILVVTLISAIAMATVLTLLSRTFSGAKKGNKTLLAIQEKSFLLAYLKHDLRTLIHGNSIPTPMITNDSEGTALFSFFKVQTADEYGRPIPVQITYNRIDAGTIEKPDGTMVPAYGIQRTDGTTTKTFMKGQLTEFSLELLDKAAQPVNSSPEKCRKITVNLATIESELLETTVSVYSPYLNTAIDHHKNAWLNNFRMTSYSPGAAVSTYNGATIPSSELVIINGAIALEQERGF